MDINIDDLEGKLGKMDMSLTIILQELLKLTMHNNALLRIILANQAELFKTANPELNEIELQEDWIKKAIELTQKLNLQFLSANS